MAPSLTKGTLPTPATLTLSFKNHLPEFLLLALLMFVLS